MKSKLLGVVAALALLVTTRPAAYAGTISLADFGPTAAVADLNNLPLANPDLVAAPLTVGIYTFATDDGQLRYATYSASSISQPQTGAALGDNTDLGFINISIAPGAKVTKFGFLVGLGGEAQHHRETVSFFDTNNVLLGSTGVGSGGGFVFVGFENTAGYIGRALVEDTDLNSSVVAVDNLTAQSVVPLPTALPLFATGLGIMGLLGWRRMRKAAAA